MTLLQEKPHEALHVSTLPPEVESWPRDKITLITQAGEVGKFTARKYDPNEPIPQETRYLLSDIIGGQGGMAKIYKIFDLKLNRFVAFKYLHSFREGDTPEEMTQSRENFRREAQLLARAEHIGVVLIYDFIEVDGQPAIVMKWRDPKEAPNLRDLLHKQGTLNFRQLITLIHTLGQVIDNHVAQKILHLDIKPSNIIINRDAGDTVELIDYGIARDLSDPDSWDSEVVATPRYLSPERAFGKDTNVASEVFSLGLVIFEVFSGKPFFFDHEVENPQDIVKAVAYHNEASLHQRIEDTWKSTADRYPQLSQSDLDQIAVILSKALSPNPVDRYPTATQFANEIIVILQKAQAREGTRTSQETSETVQSHRNGFMSKLREIFARKGV